MPESPESPWWLAIAAAIVAGLVGAVGKVWAANVQLRKENAMLNTEHKRDLKRVIGWPNSVDPPPPPSDSPLIIRDKTRRTRVPRKPQ